MSQNELEKILHSIDLTLSQPGALFQLETRAEGITNISYGVADFQNVAHTSKDTFNFAVTETEENAQVATNEVISLFHQGEIFHLLEVDGGNKEWTVFDTGDSGWDSSILAPLFWLKGVEQVKVLEPSHYQLSINMNKYIAKQPTLPNKYWCNC